MGFSTPQFLKRRAAIFFLAALLFLFVATAIAYFSFEAYLKYRIIPLASIRPLVTSLINKEIGKAVDLGVVDFSLREGIILEDLVISREEDFAFNANLLKVKKVTFRLSSYWGDSPYIEQVDFYEPLLVLDANDKVSDQLLDYFQNSKIPRLRFHDAKVTLFRESETILEWKDGWEITIKRKEGQIVFEFSNGIFWIPNATRIEGSGQIPEKSKDSFRFQWRWKNFSTEETRLLTNYVMGGSIQSATTSGEAVWEKLVDLPSSMKGEIDFKNANILIPNLTNHWLAGINFKEKFYFKELKEEREFLSDASTLQWTEEGTAGKEVLQTRSIRFQSEDLSFLAKHFQELSTGDYLPFGGKARGELQIQETGEKSKWFKVKGGFTFENIYWQSPLFTLDQGHWETKIENNQLGSSFSGLIFGKKFSSQLNSTFDFTRLKKTDGSFYYPLISKNKGEVTLEKLISNEWVPLYENWKKETQEEIKERQEKIIPEEFFYQKKIFKYLLEGLNLELNLLAKETKSFPESSDFGAAKGSLVVKDGRSNLIFETVSQKNRITFATFFAGKLPSIQFNIELDGYEWGRSWFNLCGMNLNPKTINLDYKFASQGSDYYTLTKDSRINYQWKGTNARLESPEFLYRMGFPDSGSDPIVNLEFSSDRYFEVEYFRNISFTGAQLDLKGYGGRKQGILNLSLYGNLGLQRGNFAIFEEEGKCSFK